ncbi:MAG: tellurite resistance TerB family protein [Fimbriiglobus sp.]
MGLFDNIFGGSSGGKAFSKQESFAGILLAACAADGHIAEEEAVGMWSSLERMKLFQNYTPDKFNQMMGVLIKVLKRDGVDKLVDKCLEGLPDELRETAFANAVNIVLADGVVEDEEKQLVEKLQAKLEIPGDRALDIVQVMVIKNRG